MMAQVRDRILDAFAELLSDEGERHATLEAVARRAGVSKGGLLYHFPSKDRLVDGLCDRLREFAAQDVERMRAAPDGPARYYIQTSYYAGTPMDRALVAVARLQQAGFAAARSTAESVSNAWLQALVEGIGDLDAARAVKLAGDGLYYNALFGALGGHQQAPPDEGLLGVIDRITRGD
jgi:AcrR family transcriptional regulator